MNGSALFVAVFLACAVEAVEALTIVLAAATAREWPSALKGAGAGVVVLVAAVAVLGPAVSAIPLAPLRLVVGGLLLIFGLQWLRKAILRSSGHKELQDEEEAFQSERVQAAAARDDQRAGLDWYSFTVAFKGVLLEGLEVVFIVIAFGSAQHELGLAAGAAAAAVLVVVLAGVLARGPLSRVPENTIKFGVGLLLTSFGCFWAAEGAGVDWPGDELALLGVTAFFAAVSFALVGSLRRERAHVQTAKADA